MSIENIRKQISEISQKTAFAAAALLLVAGAGSLAGCSDNGNQNQNTETENKTVEQASTGYDFTYSNRDLDPSYDDSSATHISLNGSTATVDGTGADVSEGLVSITEEGVYVLSGEFSGTVEVAASDTAKVQLVLANTSIVGDLNAISVKTADKVFITLDSGSNNALANTSDAEDGAENNAAVWSDCDLTVQGEGSLVVNSVNDGIKTQDDLAITAGNYEVNAADDGVVGHDSVKISEATLNITAYAGDGIKSSQSDKEYKGFVYVDSGNISINSPKDDGISAATHIRIAGGEISVNAKDKGIVSDDTMKIEKGKLSIEAGGDGIHAEFEYIQDDGDITVTRSNEGIESQVIEINGGDVSIISDDDGMNASKGESAEEKAASSDTGAENQMFGKTSDPMASASEECKIIINGGNVYVDAAGDGVDTNGTMEFNGGTIAVNGPANDGNAALDSALGIYSNGANVIAVGSAGMFEGFSADSSKAFVEANIGIKSGDVVTIADGDKVLASVMTSKSAAIVTASSTDMEEGKEYQIIVNGVLASTVNAHNCAFDGTVSGGTSTTVAATKQSSGTGMMGMMGGRGGMQNPPSGGPDAQGTPTPPDGGERPRGVRPGGVA